MAKSFFAALHKTHESLLRKWKTDTSRARSKLHEQWRRWRRPGRHMDRAISAMAQSTTVITVTEVTIKNWQPAFFAPPKQQSSRNAMYPPSTILFTSMGSVCWWQRKKLWEAHLSTANNFAPSHLGLPQNMAVEMRVTKIWTIYFQTVLLEFLGKEGVFEYYKTKPLFLNIYIVYVSFIPCYCTFL